MYKLFYFDPSPAEMRYKPCRGVWPFIEAFFVFLRLRFGSRRFFYSGISKLNFIKIPFNGVHEREATGYSLSAIKSRKVPVSLAAKREGPGSRL